MDYLRKIGWKESTQRKVVAPGVKLVPSPWRWFTSCLRGHFVKRKTCVLPCLALLALTLSVATAQNTPTKPLTIDAIFQPGGLAGRGPETTEWSPDGTKFSFVQRDSKGEKGELWYVDATTGEKKVLVSAAKLASLDPDVNKVKNERE